MSSETPSVLLVEFDGPVANLTMNRPSQCNALNEELNRRLLHAFEDLRTRTEIKVVVLRGNGRHFCAGSDLNDLYDANRETAARVIGLEVDVCFALSALPQCTVAVVHGKCFGGGAALPLYCDIRLGYPGVEFAMPEILLGWLPPWGLNRMLMNLPRPFVLEMLLSGRSCPTQDALQHGWIQHVLSLDEDGSSFVASLAALPANVLQDTLRFVSPRHADEILADDQKSLAIFLDHFEGDHARASVNRFIKTRSSQSNVRH